VLVPTVVPGVNDDEMGDVVRFGLANLDVVESVNFQPVAHFGRYADHDGRFALDDAARLLAEQVEPLGARDMMPIPCCSSYCQMATALMPDDDGSAVPLTAFIDDDAYDAVSGLVDESDWMELLASTADGRESACSVAGCCGIDVPEGAEGLLGGILPITITGFMDADAADAKRLDNCCIAVPTESGELVPFCAYNMTTDDGEYAIRNRNGWGGRDGVGADLPEPPESEVEHLDVDGTGESDDVEADGGTVGGLDHASDGADPIAGDDRCCGPDEGC
jgi:hypothetical protein